LHWPVFLVCVNNGLQDPFQGLAKHHRVSGG
jgi:hypothetical protein